MSKNLTTAQIIRRLEKIASLVNSLDADLKEQWGPHANVFFESAGGIYAMTGDVDGTATERQTYVIASTDTHSRHGVGAW